MTLLFSTPDSVEAGLVKGMLDQAGIASEIRNDDLYENFPGAPFHPELWILNDDDLPRASELLAAWRRPSTPASGPWICPRCGAGMEAEFIACWKCGTVRETRP
jgi:hypothetical protein